LAWSLEATETNYNRARAQQAQLVAAAAEMSGLLRPAGLTQASK
jgi:hypothetical protein